MIHGGVVSSVPGLHRVWAQGCILLLIIYLSSSAIDLPLHFVINALEGPASSFSVAFHFQHQLYQLLVPVVL
jgi:hypothetical protein